uniref:Uncharacterized protein n=1 Tax=Caenorhabditis japonica TaxID=281687 RepID=A0A8R1I9H5_CAEJA
MASLLNAAQTVHNDSMCLPIEAYEWQRRAHLQRLEEFRNMLELRPIESVELYEECILDSIRFGWDDEAFKCAELLANVIKKSSRYKKLALAWRLKSRHDMCMLLLTRYLDDFFCDFPICAAFFDRNRLLRFRYTMWDQGDVYVFGDNRNRLLGVKQEFIPKESPMKLKLPTEMAALGSSQFHTIFQGINGELFGCGAARNFMINPKNDNEIFEEPTKIDLKFEPTDPVKMFYVADQGTLIITDKYIYLIGRKIDTKKTGKKWTSAFPEKWFAHVGKGNQMSKNLMRFTIDSSAHSCANHQQHRDQMPINGSYITKDNYAIVDFKGKPIRVHINEKNAYYQFENDTKNHIINYVLIGTEMKMGQGPDVIHPNGLCVTLDAGQTLMMGRLRWAKKSNCTDEDDVKQYTLLAYMDECHGSYFMERFVATPGSEGYIYQVGRSEKRPFYTMKPACREAARLRMYRTYKETKENYVKEREDNFKYANVMRLMDIIDQKIQPDWFETPITYDSKHVHIIGFMAFALTERTRLLKCHKKCPKVCWRHPWSRETTPNREPFREVVPVPRLMDSDSDRFSSTTCLPPKERMDERMKELMNYYDDHMSRFTPIWHSSDTRTLCETVKMINELEIDWFREQNESPQVTPLGRKLLYKCLKNHMTNIKMLVQFLDDNQKVFTSEDNEAHIRSLYNLACVALTWVVEYVVRGTQKGWDEPKQTRIETHFKTRNPRTILERKIASGLIDEGEVPMDVNIRYFYAAGSWDDTDAHLDIHTNKVLLSMLNPKLVDYVKKNELSLNMILYSFTNTTWAIALEYSMTVFFFLQHYKESPVTVNENEVPHAELEKLGFKLELKKHAADSPDRIFDATWHYATLKCINDRKDEEIIAPIGMFGNKDIWILKCRDGVVKVHRYLIQVFSRHPLLTKPANKNKIEMNEKADVVVAAFRMLPDINTVERYDWNKQIAICRFFCKYMFDEALDDALAALVLLMKEEDSEHIRTLIADFPIIMERHIGVLRPTIILLWKDDFLPEPKTIHMARIIEYWPGKQYVGERLSKTYLDSTFVRLLRTDEQWKRDFFTHPDDVLHPDLCQMLKEDMFTKTTFDYSAPADCDET